MLRLILMRHAKSSWDNLNLADHDRPLNDRGQRSATLMGQWLRAQNYIPQEAICSTATRCVETWEHVGIAGEFPCEITYRKSLYHAAPEQMINALHKAQKPIVIILGHNPGIGLFADQLLSTPPTHPKFIHYPTAAITVIDFKADAWDQVKFKSGKLQAFQFPKELA